MTDSVFKKILYILIILPGLALLINEYSLVGIVSFIIILLLGFIFLLIKKSITSYHFEIVLILSIIYIYFMLSYFTSNQTISNFFSYQFFRYDGNFFFNYIPFFALAVPYFDYKKAARIFIIVIFSTFTLVSFIGLIEYLTEGFSLFFRIQNGERVFTALNFAHNATGSVYALVCIFLLAFILLERKIKKKALLAIAFVVCLAGLLLTRSRGGYIGFAMGTLVVLWLYFKSWIKFLVTAFSLAAVTAPIVYATGAFSRIIKIFDFTEANISWRFILWQRAWHLFLRSPIFGVGFGRYNDISYEAWTEVMPNPDLFIGFPGAAAFYMEPYYEFSFSHAHNSYFNFLAETGLLGLGLLIFFWIVCYRRILRGYNFTKDNYSKKIFLSCMGGIAALFALSLTENYFSATTVMMCLSMIVSLAIGIHWQETFTSNNDFRLIQNQK